MRQLTRTIALMLIAGTLGAWLGFVVFGSDDGDHGATDGVGAPHDIGAPHTSSAPQTATGSGHMHEGGPATSAAAMMVAVPESVEFCVGASLEPFEGAMTQLRETGPAEAAERMRSCVFDTIIGHGDDATMVDLESHRERFAACFGELQVTDQIDKPRAAQQTSACILAGLPSS